MASNTKENTMKKNAIFGSKKTAASYLLNFIIQVKTIKK